MAMKWEQLEAEARRLSKFDRGRLAASIIRSLSQPDEKQSSERTLDVGEGEWA